MKKLLKVSLWIVAVIVVLTVILEGLRVYSNYQANKEAQALCDKAAVGQKIELFLESVKPEKRCRVENNECRILFLSAAFDAAVCHIYVENGVIISKRMVPVH